MTSAAPGPLCTWSEPVLDEWIDYNGHLSEPYYVLVLGHATDEVMDTVGLGPAYRERTGASLFTVEAHVRYLDQVGPGEQLEARSWVIGATRKLLWIWHELWADGKLRATEEILGVHVDTGAGSSSPFPDDVAARIAAAHVEPGPDASRSIRVGR
jgi:acyl-CoA thioester hydrolase